MGHFMRRLWVVVVGLLLTLLVWSGAFCLRRELGIWWLYWLPIDIMIWYVGVSAICYIEELAWKKRAAIRKEKEEEKIYTITEIDGKRYLLKPDGVTEILY